MPSTVHAVATGGDALGAARAAGQLLGRPSLVRGAIAHAGLSVAWAAVLDTGLPSRHRAAWGAMAGLVIAATDLSIADARFPAIAALPRGAQVADHIAFGALVGAAL